MSFYTKFYSKDYKKYLIIPAILFVICLVVIFSFGIKKSIDLSGGTLITLHTNQVLNSDDIKNYLDTSGFEDVTVTFSKGLESNRLDIQYLQEKNLTLLKTEISNIKSLESQADAITSTKQLLKNYNFVYDDSTIKDYKAWISQLDALYNTEKNNNTNLVLQNLNAKFNLDTTNVAIKEISPTLSESFYSKTIIVSLIALIGIVLLIFIAYREIVPSTAIIMCGVLDIIGGLAAMAIFGIPLSLTTIPVLLMLLGYSIDTDIMLTTKLIKRHEGSNIERAADSMRTGVYMTTTAIIVFSVILIFSILYNVTIFYDISIVLIFGLVMDLVATWLMNGPILLMYVEHKKK